MAALTRDQAAKLGPGDLLRVIDIGDDPYGYCEAFGLRIGRFATVRALMPGDAIDVTLLDDQGGVAEYFWRFEPVLTAANIQDTAIKPQPVATAPTPPQPQENVVMPDQNISQALKNNERLIASLRAENAALHEDNAALRATVHEKDILYSQSYQEATRLTRQVTKLTGEAKLNEFAISSLEDIVDEYKTKLLAAQSPFDKAANSVATSTVAAARASGGFLGRAARATGRGVKAAGLLPVRAACSALEFVADEARRTSPAHTALVSLLAASVLAMSWAVLHGHLLEMHEREADSITVPGPADPSLQREKDWIEARAKRLQSKIERGEVTPVAIRNRRVS